MLTCLLWGEADPTRLPFLDPPPAAALAEARDRLARLGAIDDGGQLTPHGRAIARLPLEPRLAHMLIEAAARGFGQVAAEVAVLVTERGLGGTDTDLEVRHRRWRSERGPRAEGARRMAANWSRLTARAMAGKCRTGSRFAHALCPRLSRPRVAPPRCLGRAVAIGRRARLPARSRLAARAVRMAGGRRGGGDRRGGADPVRRGDRR